MCYFFHIRQVVKVAHPTEGARFGQGGNVAQVFRPVSKSDAANSVTSGCRNSEVRWHIQWHGGTQQTPPAPAGLEQPFHLRSCNGVGTLWVGNLSHLPLGICSPSVRWDPGFLALLGKTYFHVEHLFSSAAGGTVRLCLCTLPCLADAELSWQGEFQLLWCCVEAQLSFVSSYIWSCSVGSCILSYHHVEKSTKKKSACSTNNWVRYRQPRTIFASRITRVV